MKVNMIANESQMGFLDDEYIFYCYVNALNKSHVLFYTESSVCIVLFSEINEIYGNL